MCRKCRELTPKIERKVVTVSVPGSALELTSIYFPVKVYPCVEPEAINRYNRPPPRSELTKSELIELAQLFGVSVSNKGEPNNDEHE